MHTDPFKRSHPRVTSPFAKGGEPGFRGASAAPGERPRDAARGLGRSLRGISIAILPNKTAPRIFAVPEIPPSPPFSKGGVVTKEST